jgi:hypothetical protein
VGVYAVIEATEPITFLRPGAFVSVDLKDKVYENIIAIPDSALYDKNTIYIINGDDRLEARRIEIRGYDGSRILFHVTTDNPVDSGDRIMITQLREGGAGIKVKVHQ